MGAPGPLSFDVMSASVVVPSPPSLWFLVPALVCFIVPLLTSPAQANPEAKRLYEDLLSTYNRLIRPVGNNSDRLTVKLGLKLSQLIDVVSLHDINLSVSF